MNGQRLQQLSFICNTSPSESHIQITYGYTFLRYSRHHGHGTERLARDVPGVATDLCLTWVIISLFPSDVAPGGPGIRCTEPKLRVAEGSVVLSELLESKSVLCIELLCSCPKSCSQTILRCGRPDVSWEQLPTGPYPRIFRAP